MTAPIRPRPVWCRHQSVGKSFTQFSYTMSVSKYLSKTSMDRMTQCDLPCRRIFRNRPCPEWTWTSDWSNRSRRCAGVEQKGGWQYGAAEGPFSSPLMWDLREWRGRREDLLSLVLTATGERKEEGWREEIASLSLLLQGWLACVMCARVIKSVERKAFGSRCVCTRAAPGCCTETKPSLPEQLERKARFSCWSLAVHFSHPRSLLLSADKPGAGLRLDEPEEGERIWLVGCPWLFPTLSHYPLPHGRTPPGAPLLFTSRSHQFQALLPRIMRVSPLKRRPCLFSNALSLVVEHSIQQHHCLRSVRYNSFSY